MYNLYHVGIPNRKPDFKPVIAKNEEEAIEQAYEKYPELYAVALEATPIDLDGYYLGTFDGTTVNKTDFTCKECNQSFKNETGLKGHIRFKHAK